MCKFKLGLICFEEQTGFETIEQKLVILVTCTRWKLIWQLAKARLNHFRDYSPKFKHFHGKKARDNGISASSMAHFTSVPGSDPNPTKESDPKLVLALCPLGICEGISTQVYPE